MQRPRRPPAEKGNSKITRYYAHTSFNNSQEIYSIPLYPVGGFQFLTTLSSHSLLFVSSKVHHLRDTHTSLLSISSNGSLQLIYCDIHNPLQCSLNYQAFQGIEELFNPEPFSVFTPGRYQNQPVLQNPPSFKLYCFKNPLQSSLIRFNRLSFLSPSFMNVPF